jgi:hypothetical protein
MLILELQDACKFVTDAASGSSTPEALFHIADTWKALSSCSGTLPPSITKVVFTLTLIL